MSVAGFSKCRIQFILNDKKTSDRDYSDRSVIELRQHDFGNYSIRALDIEHDKTEIFSFHFNQEGQYKFGSTISQPDEIRIGNGTYRFWLNAQSRTQFHDAVRTSLQETALMSQSSPSPQPRDQDATPKSNPRSPPIKVTNEKTKPAIVSDRNDLIVDVYRLGEYIRQGNSNRATDLAKQLAEQRVRLQATTRGGQSDENKIQIKVRIDSAERRSDNEDDDLTMSVYPSTTVRELRAAFEYSKHFPPASQYFFVNGHLAHDGSSMAELQTTSESSSTVTPVSAYWECVDCHVYNPSGRKSCKTCRRLRQDLLNQCLKESKPPYSEPTNVESKLKPSSNQTTINNTESTCFQTVTTKPPPNWYCVICSHHNCNNDSATNCAGCGSVYMTNIEYLNFVHEQEKQLLRYQEDSKAFREDLREQAHAAYYKNNEEFECIICYELVGKTRGVLFHHCLHPMCKRCVLQMIETSTEPLLKCPHDDCNTIIGERELRGIVKDMKRDQKLVDRLNEIGVRWAEIRHKTFHCITPDCGQWWFIEQVQGNNIVYCDGCKHWICMTCVAVHEGQNCLEYQEDLKIRAMNDVTARKDQEHLEEMIKRREAMHCPGCQVIIQKLSGCDWLQCTQCKMEICWPSRGPRWGPGGRGDTSGGCRCRVDKGKLCTKDCQNCH